MRRELFLVEKPDAFMTKKNEVSDKKLKAMATKIYNYVNADLLKVYSREKRAEPYWWDTVFEQSTK